MDDECADAWLSLLEIEGLGPRRVWRLVHHLGGVLELTRAPKATLRRMLPRNVAEALLAALTRGGSRRVRHLRRAAADAGQSVLTPANAAYPVARLEPLADPPLALFVRGEWPLALERAVAIVGTRRSTPYGEGLAREMAEHLARAGIVVVSGMAAGIDGAAHRGALEALPGSSSAKPTSSPTLAVLGTGADVPYPAEHTELLASLSLRGTVLSEHPPGTRPSRWAFPRRNRLIAALSALTVVVEAPLKSGAVLTAGLAGDLGRDVAAVPGSVRWPTSSGCHALIRDGATLVTRAEDALALVQGRPLGAVATTVAFEPPDLSAVEARLWRVLDPVLAQSEDTLAARSGLGIDALAATLVGWELRGYIQRVPGAGIRRSVP